MKKESKTMSLERHDRAHHNVPIEKQERRKTAGVSDEGFNKRRKMLLPKKITSRDGQISPMERRKKKIINQSLKETVNQRKFLTSPDDRNRRTDQSEST